MSNIQVLREITTPPRTEMAIRCRVTARNFSPLEIVEGKPYGWFEPTKKQWYGAGQMSKHWRTICEIGCWFYGGHFHWSGSGSDRCRLLGVGDEACQTDKRSIGHEMVPGYLRELYTAAKGSCHGLEEIRTLAALLPKYGTVFSTGDGDVGFITLVEHGIPVVEVTRPIRLPPHRQEVPGVLQWYLLRRKMGSGDFASIIDC